MLRNVATKNCLKIGVHSIFHEFFPLAVCARQVNVPGVRPQKTAST